MSKKIDRIKRVQACETAFQCPLCGSSLQTVNLKSLICTQNHTFDFAKQGYLNFVSQISSRTQYNKALFEARYQVIKQSALYSSMHQEIVRVIKEYFREQSIPAINPIMLADLGCGEGSHLHQILEQSVHPKITGVGLDISREGILMAAKRYEGPIWLVGDIAKLPLEDQAFQVILNILSPANYKEFSRILVRHGMVIKVVPGPYYLRELREEFFDQHEKKVYTNENTVALFKQHFQQVKAIHLQETKRLDQDQLTNLVQMTPLTWSAVQARIDRFSNQASAEVTVDVELLIGIKK